MRIEENLAEKVARLTRVSTARDASDLVWAATTNPISQLDRGLVRRVSILKVWVDNLGLDGMWGRAAAPRPFDPERWLAARTDWDDEQIGLLTQPPPSLDRLGRDLANYWRHLGDLTDEEARFAGCHANDRAQVIAAISALPHAALEEARLWQA